MLPQRFESNLEGLSSVCCHLGRTFRQTKEKFMTLTSWSIECTALLLNSLPAKACFHHIFLCKSDGHARSYRVYSGMHFLNPYEDTREYAC